MVLRASLPLRLDILGGSLHSRMWLLLLCSVSADTMVWHDPDTSAYFDWSSLRSSEPILVLSPSSDDVLTTEYLFTLGSYLSDSCSS